jgi:hypothetical protein
MTWVFNFLSGEIAERMVAPQEWEKRKDTVD